MAEKINELIKKYRDIRDDLGAKRKEFDLFEKECKEQMEELELKMLSISDETGVDSFKTEYGTAYRTIKTYARLGTGPESKEAREKYALDTGDFGLFTAHVNKTHAKELRDEGVDLVNIGIDWVEEYAIGFRKPTN